MSDSRPGASAGVDTAAPAGQVPPSHRPWLVLSALCLGFFMILLDTTVVNIAIPDMIDRLDASLDQILWILNAYILVYAVLLISAGRLGDIVGPKQLFLVGLAVFTVSSTLCGLSQNPTQLIIFRVLQGIGGALLTPQTLSVITMIFPLDKRGAAFGIWGAVAGVATVAGPTLGGWLVTSWDWRWIFFINVPVGVFAIVLGAAVIPNIKLNRHHQLDWTGTTLATASLFLICYGLIEGEAHDWGAVWGPVTIGEIIGTGLVLLAVFGWQQYASRRQEPLIPFRIFADRNFALMNIVVAVISFGMIGIFLPLSIYLQSVLGLTALQAGLTVAPMSLLSMVIAPFAGRFADRLGGGKYILVGGITLWVVGLSLMVASVHTDSNQGDLIPGLVIAGAGLGCTFAPLQTIAMRNIAPRMAGAASGLINTARQLGAVISSAAVGALLQSQLSAQLATAAQTNAAALPEQFRDQFVAGFSDAAGKGLEVGTGQTGVRLPADIPAEARSSIIELATTTFHEAFTLAMRHTLVLPLALLGSAALGVLLIKRPTREQVVHPDSAAKATQMTSAQ